MNAKLFVLISLFVIVLSACDRQEDPSLNDSPDYFIFGHFFGECIGEQCIEIYMLREGQLYEDTTDQYPSFNIVFYDGDFDLMDQSLYDEVRSLEENFPSQIVDEDKVIGMPDAGDWGGYYVEKKEGSTITVRLIDTMKGNIPAYLHDYVDELGEKVDFLSNR